MEKMQRIPLDKRLGASGDFPPRAAWLYLETYFRGMTRACESPKPAAPYWRLLKKCACVCRNMHLNDAFVAQAVAMALTKKYPAEIGNELLYLILVGPFRDVSLWEGGEQ